MIQPIFSRKLSDEEKAIRQEVFVIEQGFIEEFDERDGESWHLVLLRDGLAIASARFYAEDPETYHIGRVAVRKEYRMHHVGTYLMRFVETKIRELGGRRALVSAQMDKKGFYEKCGYRDSGDGEIYLDQGCPHLDMAKLLVTEKRYRSRAKY